MSGPLVLSIFPGIDLLGRAFEDEGFCVVRGPDVLWGGDVRTFHPPAGRFEGIIGGPPCQHWSRMRHLILHNGYELAPDLIPEFERVVGEAQVAWFLMEEVESAPIPNVPGYEVDSLLLNNRWVGGEQHRVRRFSFGTQDGRHLMPEVVALEAIEWAHAVTASAGGRPVPVKLGSNGQVKKTYRMSPRAEGQGDLHRACRLQGLPENFLADAPFTKSGKLLVVGNGVPLPMGRAIARAVKQAMGDAT